LVFTLLTLTFVELLATKYYVIMGHIFTDETARKVESCVREKSNVEIKIERGFDYKQYVPYELFSKLQRTKEGEYFSGWTEVVLEATGTRTTIKEIGLKVNLHYPLSENKHSELYTFHFSLEGSCIKDNHYKND